MKVTEAYEEYQFAIARLAETSQSQYASKLKPFVDWCEKENVPLEGVNQKILRRFTSHISQNINPFTNKPIAPITVHGYMRVVKAFLNWCSQEEDFEKLVSESVGRRMQMPKVEKKVIEVFSGEQISRLLVACKLKGTPELQVRNLAIVCLLVDTGIRANELCTLTLDNVWLNVHDLHIRVLGKGNKWREVALYDRSAAALKRYISRYRPNVKDTHVFLGRTKKPLSVNSLEQVITTLGELASIEGVRCSPHTFRHTFAVNYLQATGDIHALSKVLGHTDLQTTQIYVRTNDDRMVRQRGISVLNMLS